MAKKKIRLIARLDVKDTNLVKGIQLEGLRKLGDPNLFAREYYEQGIDELLYIDIVASLYNRNNLSDIVRKTVDDVYIPVCVGGGLRSVEDVRHILSMGADKVAINTAAIKRPELITEVANAFGSQCMVLSIQAKRSRTWPGKWEAYYDNGRAHSGYDVVEWAKRGVALGAGEILLMSVDNEGLQRGMDLELIEAVTKAVNVPVICGGGVGCGDDIVDGAKAGADAVACAAVLHYKKETVQELKDEIRAGGAPGMKVTVIDYGLSNLLSVQHAFAHFGAEVQVTSSPADVLAADALVLPGVGAFQDGMQGLEQLGLIEPIKQKTAQGTPLLGICLGMQMLFDESEEFGLHKGLGLIPGRVVRIPDVDADGSPQRVPHISWNPLYPAGGRTDFSGTALQNVQPGQECYFIHSYEAKPAAEEYRLADTVYGGRKVCAAAQNGCVIGTQFHPEKSGPVGLGIIKAYLDLCGQGE